MNKAPKNCRLCQGNGETFPVIENFQHTDYGHLACKKCGITFDSNVNEFIDVKLNKDEIRNIKNESEYRKLFIETSTIASKDGDVYDDFDWNNSGAMKSGIVKHALNSLRENFDPDNELKILDIGCGNGFTTIELSKLLPNSKIIGIDPSPEVLKANGANGIATLQGTLDSLQLPAGKQDAVIIIGNLMLHNNLETTLLEARRLLKDGGLLIIDFKNVDSSLRRILKTMARFNLSGLVPKSILDRGFLNMRYGLNAKYVSALLANLESDSLENVQQTTKAARVFQQVRTQSGIKGIIWRVLDAIDRLSDQRAWVQMTFRKQDQTGHKVELPSNKLIRL